MSADVLVRGGTVVLEHAVVAADVRVTDGRITEVGAVTARQGEQEIDATGCLVAPGGVDAHCHVGFRSGAFRTLDGYREATVAALHGGTTTIVDFAIPEPGEGPVQAMERQLAQGEGARFCDTALHGCIVGAPEGDVSGTVRQLAALGTRTVKLFTTYRGESMAEERTILGVLEALQEVGGLAVVHCENDAMIAHSQQHAEHAGQLGAEFHDLTRPVEAELAAVSTLLQMASQVRAPVYFVHQSTAAAVKLVHEARSQGVSAYSEVVGHHVTLSDSAYRSAIPEAFVCCPPLRSEAERRDLVSVVAAGQVDVLASDHCCYSLEQKRSARHDVRAMPNGLPGVETRVPVLLDELVLSGAMAPAPFFSMVATKPAKLNGLYPRKGAIRLGADADLVLWDLDRSRTVTRGHLHMATDYTPYEGRRVRASVRTVLVRGRVVVEAGELRFGPPTGEFVPSADLVLW